MKEHLISIIKGAAIAAVGAGMTYALPMLLQISYVVTVHGHPYDLTPVVVAGLSVVANIARKAAGL